MAYFRERCASQLIEKLSKLWAEIGTLGPRQCGKTTLIQNYLGSSEPVSFPVSFDDLENQQEAARSPKSFLAKLGFPAVIDEVQKVPAIFDAIKLNVDKKRIPGSYFLTGSSGFSSKIGIRESLTGRIRYKTTWRPVQGRF
jgi:predicted AAA+ superfamily ATPase